MKWELGKEKLVYILNPDGLTESIFVAKGEKNEGQYRGKRFTKAGLKAEKKRMQDELKASLQVTTPQEVAITEPINMINHSVSLAEYDKTNNDFKTEQVRIFGSLKGWFILFDVTTNDVLKYEEYDEPFKSKTEIQNILIKEDISDAKFKIYKTNKGAVFFKGFGEITS